MFSPTPGGYFYIMQVKGAKYGLAKLKKDYASLAIVVACAILIAIIWIAYARDITKIQDKLNDEFFGSEDRTHASLIQLKIKNTSTAALQTNFPNHVKTIL